ncbi:Na(+)/H(+) antiporter subunit B [Desulfatibacillum aliphaticivorans]|uniref:Na(+)/H(+) antiporter subunit B n=1 Tax=Desulfatibacillum aliphaticivorans TaxID=218208 RepID=UPI000422C052|nr:Na(+)/H(+) antiporter subunit B [Desulfatibacillum aliphaticivorans]
MLCCWGMLVHATLDFPGWGDPNAPAHLHVAPEYLEQAYEETATPNVVTAVLADYRGYDTMFETAVIFSAGLACFFLLRVQPRKEEEEDRFFRHLATDMVIRIRTPSMHVPDSPYLQQLDPYWTPRSLIVRAACRVLTPFIQLFALYVVAHGHHSPGGGFQGGVILGASFILIALSHDLRTSMKMTPEKLMGVLSPAGVLIYAGVGALCVVAGHNFLDYGALAEWLGTAPEAARSLGILFVEVGVAVCVMATMIIIYANLSSAGGYKQGL